MEHKRGRATRRMRTSNPRTSDPFLGIRPPCVLVADDDDDLRALIVAALRMDRYDVLEARTGPELLDRVASCMRLEMSPLRPDLLVSDVRMPGFTGLEALECLRKLNWQRPILLMTAHHDEAMYEEARSLGARAIFTKPFELDDLRTAILNLVRDA